MELKTLEEAAWYKRGLPKGASIEDIIIYCVCRAAYADLEDKVIDELMAKKIKTEGIKWVKVLRERARANSTVIRELNILTAPRKSIVKMDKAQLINIIVKMEALSAGLIKTADQEPPEFMNLEV